MKLKLSRYLSLLGVGILAPLVASAVPTPDLVIGLDYKYSTGADPVAVDGSNSWLTATFSQIDANSVKLKLDATNLDSAQKIGAWGFNFDDLKDVSGLMAPYALPIDSFSTAINGKNQGGSSGHGFDFEFGFDTSNGNKFAGGTYVDVTLTYDTGSGPEALSVTDFDFTNTIGFMLDKDGNVKKAGTPGTYMSAAHIQSIPNGGDSAWIAGGANVIPEPSTYALIFGGFALGVVVLRKRFAGRAAKEA